jgi:hypothetical protein
VLEVLVILKKKNALPSESNCRRVSIEHGSPESLHVNVKLSRNVFSPSPMGLVLTISALEGWAIRALTKKWLHLSSRSCMR